MRRAVFILALVPALAFAQAVELGGEMAPIRVAPSLGDSPILVPTNDQVLLRLLPAGNGWYNPTTGTVGASTGSPLTFTRASTRTCTEPTTGAIASLATGKPCVTSLGLSMEPAGTNLLLQSEALDGAPWVNNGSPTVTANTWDFGTGSATGDEIVFAGGNAFEGRFEANLTAADTNGAVTGSCYTRAGSSGAVTNAIRLQVFTPNAGGGTSVNCDSTPTGTTARATCTMTVAWPVDWIASTVYSLNALARPIAKNGHFYKVTTAGTSGASAPTWCTTGSCTTTDGTVTWTEQGVTQAGLAAYHGSTSAGSVKVGGCQLETGSIATSYIPTTGTAATRAAEAATVPTPSGLSLTEGCACLSITPNWTGAVSATTEFLDANSAAFNAQLGYVTSSDLFKAFDGTNSPLVTAGWTAGVKKRYCTRWSATGGFLRVENTSAGTSASTAFSTFPAFSATTSVGHRGGANEANGSLSDIVLGRTASACQ